MATITETAVKVSVVLYREPSGDRIEIAGVSLDAAGSSVRSASRDITNDLTAGQRTTITGILDAAEARAKAYFNIP